MLGLELLKSIVINFGSHLGLDGFFSLGNIHNLVIDILDFLKVFRHKMINLLSRMIFHSVVKFSQFNLQLVLPRELSVVHDSDKLSRLNL